MSNGSTQTLVEVSHNGSELVVGSGARYTVRPEDREKSNQWYPPQRVVVKQQRGNPSWPLTIKNVDLPSLDQVSARVSSLD
jgi:hypothetical protein